MKAKEAQEALSRIKEVYEKHEARSSNIEFSVQVEGGLTIYSVKGTSKNREGLTRLSLVRDIVSDIRFLPRRSQEMKTWHPGGFRDAGEALANEVSSNHFKTDRIQFEGHSLGAAAAIIAADILKKRRYNVERIIGFGSPKTGKVAHAATIEHYLFKYGRDVVTTVPPFYWSLPVINIPSLKGRPTGFLNKAKDLLGAPKDSIDEHSLDEYIAAFSLMNPEEEVCPEA